MGSERQTQFSVRRASVILATLAALTISAPGLTTDTYHYDPQGRLTSITNENGSTIAYSYDEAGNRSGVTITNPSGLLSLSSTSYGGGEASGQRLVSVTVNRTGGSGGPASVNYATSNGTAVAGSDYTAASGTLNWTNFDAAPKSFTVTILDDATYEGSETFNVALSGASGATLAAPMSATISIADDEPAPPGSIQLSTTSFSVGEAGSSATITATRTGGSNGPVGVSYATSNGTATAGSDYTSTSGTLSWTNGDSANKTFAIPITNDSAVESSETVNITLSAPTGGATLGSPSTGTLTITDDDSTLALQRRGERNVCNDFRDAYGGNNQRCDCELRYQ
jgi:YD repeat-containing protein